MAVDRLTPEGAGDELLRLYTELEQALARGVAQRLAAGKASPRWVDEKLAAAGELRRWAERQVGRANASMPRRVLLAIRDSVLRGRAAAERDAPRSQLVRRAVPETGQIEALARALSGRLEATGPQVVRSVVDAYRQAVTAGAAVVLGGAQTRQQATAEAWNRLLGQGFTGFTDVRGRRWSLASYAEMATRTTTAQAAVQGQLDRQAELGLELVIVSNAPQECKRCRPWEGKVLTRDERGRGGATLEVEHATEDRTIRVRVAGSVDEAIRDGLLHPNCRHSLSAYLPGVTEAPTRTADPEGDAARQRLRALERDVRTAKLREAGALTPEQRAAAKARIAQKRAEIRQHVKDTAHLGIKRKPERERPDLGMTERASAPAPGPTREQRLLEQYRSGVEHERQLGGGVMAKTDLVTTRGGDRLVRKRSLGYTGRPPAVEQDAEELGAAVVRALGGRAPAVARQSEDVVLMEYVDGKALAEVDLTSATAVPELAASEQGRRLALADLLMGNVDRNLGNVLQDERGALHGIDHGGAFDWHPEYNPPGALPNFPRNFGAEWLRAGAYTRAELEQARAALQALQPEFDRLGHRDWLEAALQRVAVAERELT